MSIDHFIYEWTNKRNGKKYIGSHSGSITDNYKGSGVYFKKAYKKEPHNFERKILKYTENRESLLFEEERILTKVDAGNNEMYYNLSNTSGGGNNHIHLSEEERNRIYQKMTEASTSALKNMSVTERELLKKKKQKSWETSSKRDIHAKRTKERRILEEKNKSDEDRKQFSEICKKSYWNRPKDKIKKHHEKQSKGVKQWYKDNPDKYEERKKFLKNLNLGKIYINKNKVNKRIYPDDLDYWTTKGWVRGMYREKRKS